jgi:glycopeptide antibiotics resistance protein
MYTDITLNSSWFEPEKNIILLLIYGFLLIYFNPAQQDMKIIFFSSDESRQ